MKKRRILLITSVLVLISFVLLSYVETGDKDNFSERVKIALRNSGNRLLLSNNDSTSLILPIIELDKNNFQLSFQNKLSIVPDSLVKIINSGLLSSNLPNSYIVEVINRDNQEVYYSYEIKKDIEKNIIPCLGRNLPYDNYKIKILFTEKKSFLILDKNYPVLAFVMIGFIGFGLLYWKQKSSTVAVGIPNFTKVGSYKFYKEENRMVKGNKIIELTIKECELISIFSEKPNQIIKRELLVKEVWEDNGVFVGRSLDTFISKIRKKFKDDDSFNIVSIHGVGYKLEIT